MPGENGLPVPEILWYSCDGMMVIDEKRRVLAINPALERLTGRSKEVSAMEPKGRRVLPWKDGLKGFTRIIGRWGRRRGPWRRP